MFANMKVGRRLNWAFGVVLLLRIALVWTGVSRLAVMNQLPSIKKTRGSVASIAGNLALATGPDESQFANFT